MTRVLAVAAAVWLGAASVITVSAAAGHRTAFGAYSIVVPPGWSWRALPDPDGRERAFAQLSSHSLRRLDENRLAPGQVIVTIYQLGAWGSRNTPTVDAREFSRARNVAGPAQARASHGYCSPGGRCFSIGVIVGRARPLASDLSAVNTVLRSIVAGPASLPR